MVVENMIVKKQFLINANRNDVWEVFMNPEKLATCVPGCKEIKVVSPTRYDAVVELKAQLMKLKFQATGELKNAIEKEQLTVEMTGKPLAMVGLFQNTMTVHLSDAEPGATMVDYEMDIQVSGKLATMGSKLMKGSLSKSAGEFAENVQSLFQHS